MAWQTLHISTASRLSLKQHNLLIEQKDQAVNVSLEDLACLVVDTKELTFTSALLSRFCELGIAVIFPDQKHMPAGMLLSFHQHYAQSEIAYLQINATEPLKKRLWQKIVRQKIINQAALLSKYNAKASQVLIKLANEVKSGDEGNIEGHSARFYFQHLFPNFNRQDDNDFRNSLLNYGYAIVRSALARAVVASGLLPTFGVHHHSKHNPFNLVDDLIEPYRAMVDAVACERLAKIEEWGEDRSFLTPEDKRFMTSVLTKDIELDGRVLTILTSTEIVVPSFVRDLRAGNVNSLQLVLPKFLEEDH